MSAFSVTPRFLTLVAATALAITGTGCDPELPESAPANSASTLNFSRYEAIGDDFTAGFSNGGLTLTGQQVAYPALLAQQFALVGGGTFTAPLLPDGTGTGSLAATAFTSKGIPLLATTAPNALTDTEIVSGVGDCDAVRPQYTRWAATATGLPNNMGVPGLRLNQLATLGLGNEASQATATYGAYNAYLERLLPAGDNRSYLDLLSSTRRQRTFFTVFIGLSDVLPYVQSGGTCGTLPTVGQLTAPITQLLDSLTSGGAKGAIITLPSLTDLPLTRTRVADLPALLDLPAADTTFYVAGPTPADPAVVISKTTVVLYPMLGRIGRLETATGQAAGTPFGTSAANPLRRQDILPNADATRITNLLGVVNDVIFNATRTGKFASKVAYINGGNFFLGLGRTGLLVDGVRYSANPTTGNFFSYDGYTLAPRGQALLANVILNGISAKFGTRLPLLDANKFPATPLP